MQNYRKYFLSAVAVLAVGTSAISASAVADLTEDQQRARAIYKEAVETPTFAGNDKTPELVAKFVGRLKAAGFTEDEITVVDTQPGHQSLMVRYPGKNRDLKAIGFLGHMDVVTAYKKDWVLDPFTLTEKDGFFMGRGTADNKAGVAGILATFIKLRREGYVPDRDMVIFFTDDEETGMVSTKMLAKRAAAQENIEYVFNGDAGGGSLSTDGKPQVYGIQAAEKSYYTVKFIVTNPGGHSSRPRKDNAIYQLNAALLKLQDHVFPTKINEVTALALTTAAKSEKPAVAKALLDFVKNPQDEKAGALLSDIVQYNAVIRTTCTATMLEAGHAENALPQSAEATVNCRIMPGTPIKDIHAKLEEIVDDEGVKVVAEAYTGNAPASPLRDDVIAAVRYAVDGHYAGADITANMSSGGTDGKEFRALGMPTYGVGGLFVTKGVTVNAHGLNEKISVESFYKALDHWDRLIKFATGGVEK